MVRQSGLVSEGGAEVGPGHQASPALGGLQVRACVCMCVCACLCAFFGMHAYSVVCVCACVCKHLCAYACMHMYVCFEHAACR